MQTNKLKNLIASIYYSYNNNNKIIIKRNNKIIKVIKRSNKQTLTSVYKNLYKHYNCSLQQLNTLQYFYAYNNVNNITKYYNTYATYSKVCKCYVANNNINKTIKQLLQVNV